MRVLLIEDDVGISRFLKRGLSESSFVVDEAADGEAGLAMARSAGYDVIILDLMLPSMDGLSVLERLRADGDETLVLCLTACDTVADRVRGLNAGADDYLVKPFSFTELLARIHALQRRPRSIRPFRIEIEDLAINLQRQEVFRGGRRIELSRREYGVLSFLARHAGEVVTRSMILDNVWDMNQEPLTNVIDVHINRLRKKVDADYDVRLIQTIRGVGYALRPADA